MKPKSENIQRNISNRLNKLKNSISGEDYRYLWDETHKLYKFARFLEVDRPRMLPEIRNQDQLGSFTETFRVTRQKETGQELDGFELHWIFDFAIFMAEEKNYTFQPTKTPVDDFTPGIE